MHVLEEAFWKSIKNHDLTTIQLIMPIFKMEKTSLNLPSLNITNAHEKGNGFLLHALNCGDEEIVNYLMNHLPSDAILITNNENQTALHLASSKGFQKIIEMLLDANVDPNFVDIKGRNALYYAIDSGNIAIVERLINKGIKLNTADLSSDTVLHHACQKGDPSIIKLLLNENADPNVCNNRLMTPFLTAIECGHLATLPLFLAHTNMIGYGIDVNARNIGGDTALHLAADCGHTAIVKWLLGVGAKCNLRSHDKKTPLTTAIAKNHTNIISLLIDYGAAIGCELPSSFLTLNHAVIFQDCSPLMLGTTISKKNLHYYPALYPLVLTQAKDIQMRHLGDHLQELSILKCCQEALINLYGSENSNEIRKLLYLRAPLAFHATGLKNLLLIKLADKNFAIQVGKVTCTQDLPEELFKLLPFFKQILLKDKVFPKVFPLLPPISNNNNVLDVYSLRQQQIKIASDIIDQLNHYSFFILKNNQTIPLSILLKKTFLSSQFQELSLVALIFLSMFYLIITVAFITVYLFENKNEAMNTFPALIILGLVIFTLAEPVIYTVSFIDYPFKSWDLTIQQLKGEFLTEIRQDLIKQLQTLQQYAADQGSTNFARSLQANIDSVTHAGTLKQLYSALSNTKTTFNQDRQQINAEALQEILKPHYPHGIRFFPAQKNARERNDETPALEFNCGSR